MADKPVVSVLVSASCPSCRQALELATRLAAEEPGAAVRIIDVDEGGEPASDTWPGFAGTPMFYLGATILSYGNPTLAQLRGAVGKEVA